MQKHNKHAIVEDEQLQCCMYSIAVWSAVCIAMWSAACSDPNFSIPTSRNVKHGGPLDAVYNLKLLNNYLQNYFETVHYIASLAPYLSFERIFSGCSPKLCKIIA